MYTNLASSKAKFIQSLDLKKISQCSISQQKVIDSFNKFPQFINYNKENNINNFASKLSLPQMKFFNKNLLQNTNGISNLNKNIKPTIIEESQFSLKNQKASFNNPFDNATKFHLISSTSSTSQNSAIYQKEFDKNLTLGYWGIQGAGQPIRLLLEYLSIPFNDHQYLDHTKWFQEDKPKLNTNFPNLPYLKDGNDVFTESYAILHYICLKSGRTDLLGQNKEEQYKLEQLKGVQSDLTSAVSQLVFRMGYDEYLAKKNEHIQKNVYPKFDMFYKDLGDKKFLLGDNLSIIDFKFAAGVEAFAEIDSQFYEKYPKFKSYLDRVMSLPGVSEYRKSTRYNQYIWPPQSNPLKEKQQK